MADSVAKSNAVGKPTVVVVFASKVNMLNEEFRSKTK